MMFGPYGWTGGTWHQLVETTSAHIIRVIEEARRRGAAEVEVTQERHRSLDELRAKPARALALADEQLRTGEQLLLRPPRRHAVPAADLSRAGEARQPDLPVVRLHLHPRPGLGSRGARRRQPPADRLRSAASRLSSPRCADVCWRAQSRGSRSPRRFQEPPLRHRGSSGGASSRARTGQAGPTPSVCGFCAGCPPTASTPTSTRRRTTSTSARNWRDPYPAARAGGVRPRDPARRRGSASSGSPTSARRRPRSRRPPLPNRAPSRDLCFSCPADLEVVAGKLGPFIAPARAR